jgi:hypothetical protein
LAINASPIVVGNPSASRELFRRDDFFAEPSPDPPRITDQFGEWLQARQ